MDELLSNNSLANKKSHKPLGEILVEAGLVSIYQLEIALEEQKKYNSRMGGLLADHGWINVSSTKI